MNCVDLSDFAKLRIGISLWFAINTAYDYATLLKNVMI